MKILILTDPLLAATDSALTPPGMPMFLPDWPGVERWEAEPALALRIGRLGKDVAAKFAHRYIDSAATALRLTSPQLPDGQRQRLAVADGTIAIGPWGEPQPRYALGGRAVEAGQIHGMFPELTRCTTIKTGDILLLPLGAPVALAPGQTVRACVEGAGQMTLRVK